MDPELRAELQAALDVIETFQWLKNWKPPEGPFVLTEEHKRLIAELEATPENQDGAIKNGRERSYRLHLEWLRRPKKLMPRGWNPSSNSSTP
jgi:hypothetical protein